MPSSDRCRHKIFDRAAGVHQKPDGVRGGEHGDSLPCRPGPAPWPEPSASPVAVVAAITGATRSATAAMPLRGRWCQPPDSGPRAAVVESSDALLVLVVEQVDQEHAHNDHRQERHHGHEGLHDPHMPLAGCGVGRAAAGMATAGAVTAGIRGREVGPRASRPPSASQTTSTARSVAVTVRRRAASSISRPVAEVRSGSFTAAISQAAETRVVCGSSRAVNEGSSAFG